MSKKILTYGGYFESFLATLNEKEIEKLDYVLVLLQTQDRVPTKFIKYLKEEIFEIRIKYENKYYRFFFIFDEGQLVILFNGIQKKSKKTPKKEIKKAIEIKKSYYADKQSRNP